MHKLRQILLLFGLMVFYLQADAITETCREVLVFWFEQLVPSMFVSIAIVQLLSDTSFFSFVAHGFRGLCPVLCVNEEALNLILRCLLLGCPANVTLINEAYQQQRITEKMALRLLLCTPVSTISFLIMNAGSQMLHSTGAGCMLWLIQLFCCFVLLFLSRKTSIDMTPSLKAQKKHSVTSALSKTGFILFLIGGYLLLFQTLSLLIRPVVPSFMQSGLRILSEFSYGCFLISKSFSSAIAFVLISALCGFGGFCVQFQAISISEIRIPILKYGCYRILQAMLAALISTAVLPLLL